MTIDLDDRIRSVMTRVADASPMPPRFEDLGAADVHVESPPSRHRLVVWVGVAAAVVVVVVAAVQIGRSASGSTVPGGEVDTTPGASEPVPSSTPSSTSLPPNSEPIASATTVLLGLPWVGLANLPDELALVPLPDAESVDLVAADGTEMRITRGEYFCVLFRPGGAGGCSQVTDATARQWMNGSQIDGAGTHVEYWLLNEGVSVELYQASGAAACASPPASVAAYPGVRLWTCVVRPGAEPPYRAVYTAGSTSYLYG